jgi:hypothetical protein
LSNFPDTKLLYQRNSFGFIRVSEDKH